MAVYLMYVRISTYQCFIAAFPYRTYPAAHTNPFILHRLLSWERIAYRPSVSAASTWIIRFLSSVSYPTSS